MSDVLKSSGVPAPLPLPLPLPGAGAGAGVVIRPGTMADVPFIDALQRPVTKMVGWMPTKQLEGHVAKGNVLVAEAATDGELGIANGEGGKDAGETHSPFETRHSTLAPLGYLIAADQYFKRDDLGIIYQINVAPGSRRGFIGAALLKAQFERSAWGCRLYCCWCAQDLEANRFWEAMGFVPIAFRAGSEKRSRVHVFWQKPIRAEDAAAAARGEFRGWWFPSKTAGGSLREDRIVLPIPPGRGWEEDLPRIYPELPKPREEVQALPEPAAKQPRESRKRSPGQKLPGVEPPAPVRRNGLLGDIPQPPPEGEELPETKMTKAAKPRAEKVPRTKRVCDPRLAAAARELRDRWLEQAGALPLLPAGKYDVTRRIDGDARRIEAIEPMKLLDAA